MNEVDFYYCEKCGNLVAVIQGSNSQLSCCGQPMKKLVAGAVDAAKEKHIPALTLNNGDLMVTIGSVEHPMTDEHFIQWITLVSGNKIETHKLFPGQAPKTIFKGVDVSGTVYAYCNLHGLWKKEFGKEGIQPSLGGCSPEFGGCKLEI
ncbi:MAG: desulfoferrodoxin [Megasphaera sp.]|jgi:superoxide reductase|uniref:desulfoferrodoxin family protein n=1 Tax=Megasphaera sueciensis TaxID=349094 RepID=UPI003D06DA2C|nr:desulfoferrodoxin [Megasphaera sp.]MCI1822400.1 desulfoferrodoxin [Megasphaera sp.]